MSAEHVPIHGEVVRLLETCRGEGAVVAVMPAGDAASHHHFYAGVSRAPALSFLEALLLVLGGDREEGGRRYEEIVVVNAGRAWSEGDLDTPPEEVIRLRSGGATVERGGLWDSWWYRRPTAMEPASPPANPPGNRPDPRGGLRAERRRAQYGELVAGQAVQSLGQADFPLKISSTETGEKFPNRYQELQQIIETLESRSHRTLLLLELGVLDYASPDLAPHEHVRITDPGFNKMDWFRKWIDERSDKPSILDIILFSRNRKRVEAFLNTGLPRRPPHLSGIWHAVSYQGQNLVRIEYPCGAFPWGESLFGGDFGFRRPDGTLGMSLQSRQAYVNRTLRSLLHGESASGTARIRFASARPSPPPRPPQGLLIDREFWSRVDVPLLRQAIRQEYFGADDNPALRELLDTLEFMQRQAGKISDPVAFHDAVQRRWRRASSIYLWGQGGMGKTHLGKILAQMVYGEEEGFIFDCEQSGAGGSYDPVLNFRYQFFGPPPGIEGSQRLTKVGSHLMESGGFTVFILDEANKISQDFAESMEILYALIYERRYLPANTALTQGRPVSLWNTIFVLSANLKEFPPAGVSNAQRGAIKRRVSDYEFKEVTDEIALEFAQWHLPRELEKSLGGVAVCTCEDLRPELKRCLKLKEKNLDMIINELAGYIEAASEDLEQSGISAANCPLILDVTDVLRRVLR